jgi:hypothetical protein
MFKQLGNVIGAWQNCGQLGNIPLAIYIYIYNSYNNSIKIGVARYILLFKA